MAVPRQCNAAQRLVLVHLHRTPKHHAPRSLCTCVQALAWPGADGPNMLVDDGGDATLLIHGAGPEGGRPGARAWHAMQCMHTCARTSRRLAHLCTHGHASRTRLRLHPRTHAHAVRRTDTRARRGREGRGGVRQGQEGSAQPRLHHQPGVQDCAAHHQVGGLLVAVVRVGRAGGGVWGGVAVWRVGQGGAGGRQDGEASA